MKTYILSISFFFLLLNFTYSQDKYLTKTGNISFFSDTKVEAIEADNNQVLSVVNLDNSEIVVHVLMKSFLFEKSLMQEHFNENYIESSKYPKAKFKGQLIGFDRSNDLEQEVVIKGELSLRGKVKPIELSSVMILKDEVLAIKGFCNISIADFDIKLPAATVNNIAELIEISFDIKHKKYEKK